MTTIKMLPGQSYLLRAFYDWIVESECTPYIVVDAEQENIDVPEQFIENGRVVLNVSPLATRDFNCDAHWLSFRARFSGVERKIRVPLIAILAIYAVENGRGIIFNEQDWTGEVTDLQPPMPPENAPDNNGKKDKPKSHLRLVE